MRKLDIISSIFFLVVALLEFLVLHDYVASIACCAMSGVCRLDAKLKGEKEE